MTQDEALDIMKMGHSVFLTGAAGTGKTFVLNKYIEYLKSHSVNPAITASTGIAATHIGGQTVHSFTGIGVYEKLDRYTLDKLEQNEKLFKRYQDVKVLIIDEISMLHASRLDMINTLFKKFRNSTLPFAGVQIIFCGDFFQLPPVVKNFNKEEIVNEGKEFAFNSPAWQELNPVVCYLEENYRQEDESLTKILNDIRFEREVEKVLHKLTSILEDKTNKDILKLYTHNIDVDSINIEKYNSLKSKEEHSYHMVATGKKNQIEILKQNCLAPEYLDLKIGTKVIFVKNAKDREYQNGTLGEVIEFDGANMPIVKTFDGRKINVGLESWQYVNDDGKVLAELSQIPLRYAWAITVHKSQGMTLDAAEIDLAKAFGSGMGYVALSRVRKFENIKLLGIHNDALRVNSSVVAQDKLFRDKSARAVKALEKYYDPSSQKATKDLRKKQEEFILACDGDLKEVDLEEEKKKKEEEKKEFEKAEKKKKINHRKDEYGNKIKTQMITLEYIRNGKSLKEIANIRELKISTLAGHIEELIEAKSLEKTEIKFLEKDIENILKEKHNEKELTTIKKELKKNNFRINKEFLANIKFKHKINTDYDTLNLLKIEF